MGVETGVHVAVAGPGGLTVPLNATVPAPALVAISRLAVKLPLDEAVKLTVREHVAPAETLEHPDSEPTVKSALSVPDRTALLTVSVPSPVFVTVMVRELVPP